MLVLNALDLLSLILYGVTNIFHHRHLNSGHTTLYKQLSYYFRVVYKALKH